MQLTEEIMEGLPGEWQRLIRKAKKADIDNGGTGANGPNAAGAPSSGFYYDDGPDGDFRARTENMFGSALGDAISTAGGLTFQLDFLNDLEVSAIMRAAEERRTLDDRDAQSLQVPVLSRLSSCRHVLLQEGWKLQVNQSPKYNRQSNPSL